MKQKLKFLLPVLIASFVVGGIVWAAFPDSLNNWQYNDTITESWANSLESTIGVTNSAVVSSHDYLIRRLTDDWDISGINALTPTSTRGLIVSASSTFTGYITAQGGFTGNASTADALKANPTDCSANQFANAIVASGNLTCAAIADADVPDTITASNYLLTADWNATTSANYWGSQRAGANLSWSTQFDLDNDLVITYGLTAATTTLTGLLTVGTINTGQGATEVYLMNQVVRSTDAVIFKDMGITYGISAATSTFTGKIIAGGLLSTASSTIITSLDLPNITVTGMNLYPSFLYSTSSWSGTTTVALGPAWVAETWFGAQCFTNAGTISLRFNDGTNYMDWVHASTTIGIVGLTINNTFTASEKRYITMGSPESSAQSISCTIKKQF